MVHGVADRIVERVKDVQVRHTFFQVRQLAVGLRRPDLNDKRYPSLADQPLQPVDAARPRRIGHVEQPTRGAEIIRIVGREAGRAGHVIGDGHVDAPIAHGAKDRQRERPLYEVWKKRNNRCSARESRALVRTHRPVPGAIHRFTLLTTPFDCTVHVGCPGFAI